MQDLILWEKIKGHHHNDMIVNDKEILLDDKIVEIQDKD